MNTAKAPMSNIDFRKAVAYRHRYLKGHIERLCRHRAGGRPDRVAPIPEQLHKQ